MAQDIPDINQGQGAAEQHRRYPEIEFTEQHEADAAQQHHETGQGAQTG